MPLNCVLLWVLLYSVNKHGARLVYSSKQRGVDMCEWNITDWTFDMVLKYTWEDLHVQGRPTIRPHDSGGEWPYTSYSRAFSSRFFARAGLKESVARQIPGWLAMRNFGVSGFIGVARAFSLVWTFFLRFLDQIRFEISRPIFPENRGEWPNRHRVSDHFFQK